MRITVCETPHHPNATESAWQQLSAHTRHAGTDLLILPEFAFLEPVWEYDQVSLRVWSRVVSEAERWLARLPELGCAYVVGAMPVNVDGHRLNRGFLWSSGIGVQALRGKFWMPDEPGGRETTWFAPGDSVFPVYAAGDCSFGLNICTELWALESLGFYTQAGAQAVITPRATAAATTDRWLALAKTVAVRAGVYSFSSNRRHDDGSCGGVGWIIDPEGDVVTSTSIACPAVTVDVDLQASKRAQSNYPCSVFTFQPKLV